MKSFQFSNIKGSIYTSFGIGISIMILIGYVFYWSTTKFIESSSWVTHTQEVLSNLEKVLSQLVDAETGQRGYLLTGKEYYLEPFNSANKAIKLNINNLRKLTLDNYAQQQKIDTVNTLVTIKMAELKETIDLKRKKRTEEAIKIVLTDKGKEIMDNIRVILSSMENEEKRLMKERMGNLLKSNITIKIITFLLIVLTFLIAITSIHHLQENIKKRKQAEKIQNKILTELNTIIENVGDAVIVTDNDSKITIANNALSDLIGINLDQITGKFCDEILKDGNDNDETLLNSKHSLLDKTLETGVKTFEKK